MHMRIVFQKCKNGRGYYPVEYSKRNEPHRIFERALPSFLRGFDNPCWVECISDDALYKPEFYASRDVIHKPLSLLNSTLIQNRPKWRLRCMPKFYVIGMPKCGTSDVFARLVDIRKFYHKTTIFNECSCFI